MPIALLLLAVLFLLSTGSGQQIVASLKERRNLAALQPEARAALQGLRARLETLGLRTFVGSTRRDAAEQSKLVAAGKSATQNSWHTIGLAVDLYPYGPDGEVDLQGRHLERFRTMHAEAIRYGFRGLAFNADGSRRFITMKDGKQKWDGPHLEFPQGMTFAQARARYANDNGSNLA